MTSMGTIQGWRKRLPGAIPIEPIMRLGSEIGGSIKAADRAFGTVTGARNLSRVSTNRKI
jgi:hypothetical protein